MHFYEHILFVTDDLSECSSRAITRDMGRNSVHLISYQKVCTDAHILLVVLMQTQYQSRTDPGMVFNDSADAVRF